MNPSGGNAAPRGYQVATALLVAVATLTLAGCSKALLPAGKTVDGMTVLKVGELPEAGYSGLTWDGAAFWTVAERGSLLKLTLADGALTAGPPIPIDKRPPGIDTESIAFVRPGVFVLGTEDRMGRSVDKLLMVEVGGGGAKVLDVLDLDYGLWATKAESNKGIEGVCVADGVVVVAVEPVWTEGGNRWGLLARRDQATGGWTAFRTKLGTQDGKLAAMDCRPGEGGAIDVLAVERHFGVSRVLKLTLPAPKPSIQAAHAHAPTAVQHAVVRDIAAAFDEVPNLEALAWVDDTAYLLSDNQYRGKAGVTEALAVPVSGESR